MRSTNSGLKIMEIGGNGVGEVGRVPGKRNSNRTGALEGVVGAESDGETEIFSVCA